MVLLATAVEAIDTPVSFGVVADIQYADRTNAAGRGPAASVGLLAQCVSNFNRQSLSFVVELGDIIDGYPDDHARSQRDLDTITAVFCRITARHHAVRGNHCLNAGTNALLGMSGLSCSYYTFTVPAAPGWRFIVLDGTDAGRGVMSSNQLAWLGATVRRARSHGERVICFCHFALLKEAARDWRMAQPHPALDIIESSGCVVAWFAGHEHSGGYAFTNGIHHVTFKAMVEQAAATFAVVTLHKNMISISGHGAEPSRELPLAMPDVQKPAGVKP